MNDKQAVKQSLFDQTLFDQTPSNLKNAFIPRMKELFASRANLPAEIYEMEEPNDHPAQQEYLARGAAVIDDFYSSGGTREQWNNLFWALNDDIPGLKL